MTEEEDDDDDDDGCEEGAEAETEGRCCAPTLPDTVDTVLRVCCALLGELAVVGAGVVVTRNMCAMQAEGSTQPLASTHCSPW